MAFQLFGSVAATRLTARGPTSKWFLFIGWVYISYGVSVEGLLVQDRSFVIHIFP